jgi:large subunit ribosomal protein L17
MHRHGYQGRKFGRERDQRSALLKGLVSNLIEHGKIETTLPKAKEIVPVIEKLITKAKQGDLSGRRQVIAGVTTLPIAYKLFDEIAPQLTERTSGHVRVTKTALRRGDNAAMAEVSFVDELKITPVKQASAAKQNLKGKPSAGTPDAATKGSAKVASAAKSSVKQTITTKKRTGVRGNR